MTLLREEKNHVQKCAVASSMLALTAGMLFGNVQWEKTDIDMTAYTVRTIKVQETYEQPEELPIMEKKESSYESHVVGETEEHIQPLEVIITAQEDEIQVAVLNDVEERECDITEGDITEKIAPMEIAPMEIAPMEIVPMETEPMETEPMEMEQVETEPKEIESAETEIPNLECAFFMDEEGMIYDVNPELIDLESGFLEFPSDCTGIRSGALAKCGENIEEIYLPENVCLIESNAFAGLGGLGWIEVAEDNVEYCACEGVLFTKDMTTLIAFPANITGGYDLPRGVRFIEDGAFGDSALSIIDTRHCVDMNLNDVEKIKSSGIMII